MTGAADIDRPDEPPPSPDAQTLVELVAGWLNAGATEAEIRRKLRKVRGLPPRPRGRPAQRRHGRRVPS